MLKPELCRKTSCEVVARRDTTKQIDLHGGQECPPYANVRIRILHAESPHRAKLPPRFSREIMPLAPR